MGEMSRLMRASDLQDLIDDIKLLDRSCGADDRVFRYRVRQHLETVRQLGERARLDNPRAHSV